MKAIHELNDKNICYFGLHAKLDNEESNSLNKKINSLIKTYKLKEQIDIRTDFLPLLEIIERLSHCDLIILPYDPSSEGSSASASIAFAAGIPVCITDVHIFNSMKDYAFLIEDNSTKSIAGGINHFKNHPEELKKYSIKSSQYQEKFSIEKSAENYFQLFENCVTSS